MSVFEPKVVLNLLKNSAAVSPVEKNAFEKNWTVSVEKRVRIWKESRNHKNHPRPEFQLRWEAEVVEYVQCLWEKSRPRSKKIEPTDKLGFNVPLLGLRFVPPSYLHVQKRLGLGCQAIEPATQYIKPLNIIHPFYYPQLATCPRCGSDKATTWEGWTSTGARELHGLICEETALGAQLRCNTCKDSAKTTKGKNKNIIPGGEDAGGHASQAADDLEGYCFATTSAAYWRTWEHWRIPRGIPIFFYRCALTRDLFDLLVEMRPSTTSAGLEERVRQLHLLEHKRRMLEYLEAFHAQPTCRVNNQLTNYFSGGKSTAGAQMLQAFSVASDPLGYADKSISGEMITEVFLDFCVRTRQRESGAYLKTLSAICGSLDNTFKAARILSVLNEENQIISWRFCQTRTNAEITELLQGLKHRHDILNIPQPRMMVADNCCQVRNAVISAMPETDSKLDVWHFGARYIAVMLQSSKSPYRGAVAADIMGAILKKHAEHWPACTILGPSRAGTEAHHGIQQMGRKKVFGQLPRRNMFAKGALSAASKASELTGSRIEGSHKGWNSLQRAQPSGVTMLTALGHDFVLRRNMRVAFSRSETTPFIKFTNSSHHLRLCNYVARLHNTLQQNNTGSQLQVLPELRDVDSGKTFGLVTSDHVATFGGLLIKEENVEKGLLDSFDSSVDPVTGEDVDLAFLASRNVIINEWQIDPALLTLPAEASRPMQPSVSKRKAVCISLDSDDEADASGGTIKKLQTLALSGSAVPSAAPGDGRLDTYFSLVRDTKSSKGGRTAVTSAGINNSIMPTTSKLPPEFSQDCPMPPSAGINNSINSADIDNSIVPTSTSKLPPKFSPDCPALTSAGINNSITAASLATGQTRSQHLFSIATGVDPRSLTFQNSDEFYLFMDMRAKFKWLSYQMTSKRWVLATEEYNCRLTKKMGQSVVQKNPQALLRALGDIEPKLMSKITKNDYTCDESFWRHHCSVVSLMKEEPGKKPQKAQTCSRCQTIMYPGPENSPLNHKKGYCADGVKQSSKATGEDLPPWPQPRGIFSEGRMFHPHVFLATVQHVYEHVFMQGPGETDLLETEAFSKLLVSRTTVHKSDDTVLFRLFKGFVTDPTTPRDRIVSHDGEEWLRINYLQKL
ncbi:hypothetical protein DFH29DRAFT_1006019 [Suillus ampliporus]|nr:hypothetical protein DFH29DRAFT_1006019 [Suillus ampliporus]